MLGYPYKLKSEDCEFHSEYILVNKVQYTHEQFAEFYNKAIESLKAKGKTVYLSNIVKELEAFGFIEITKIEPEVTIRVVGNNPKTIRPITKEHVFDEKTKEYYAL